MNAKDLELTPEETARAYLGENHPLIPCWKMKQGGGIENAAESVARAATLKAVKTINNKWHDLLDEFALESFHPLDNSLKAAEVIQASLESLIKELEGAN